MKNAALKDIIKSPTQAYFDWLKTPAGGNCVECKDFGEGVYGAVKSLLFHYTLIVGWIGEKDSYFDQFCYAKCSEALKGLREWDGRGDPRGWHRNPKTGRRRPGGDEAQEYLAH